ncbi:MAG: hypothetical protein K6A92_00055 [Lachnospiraceae bacterium]|nr:hypothetical protein [Lachnospiraceae bacterium]
MIGSGGVSYPAQNALSAGSLYAAKSRQTISASTVSAKNNLQKNNVQDTAGVAKTKQTKSLLRKLDKHKKTFVNPFLSEEEEQEQGLMAHYQQKVFSALSADKEKGFLDLYGANPEEEEELPEETQYNYKEVATKIQRAKTSVSAGQAVLAAKRKVAEVKRKISSGSGDPEELQIALTHAKRMEMVARKKKHHLEIEEMIEHTRKLDEQTERMEEAAQNLQSAVTEHAEDLIAQKEDEVFDEREEMISDMAEFTEENQSPNADKLLQEYNELVSEFGEDLLEELEETMDMLETMEVVDPHMSKEDLEQLKIKHRASENKAIAKADMDYLKDMMKHMAPSIDVKL